MNKRMKKRVEAAAKERQEYQKQRKSNRLFGPIKALILLVLLAGILGGSAYAFFIYNPSELARFNRSYRVLAKQHINGELHGTSGTIGSPTRGFSKRTDPQFFFVCESDLTQSEFTFQVPQKLYFETPVNTDFPVAQTKDWNLTSQGEINAEEVIRQIFVREKE